jgi:hypothetical protein
MRGSGVAPLLEVDQRAHGDVEVEFAALFLVADTHLVLRLEQVEQALQVFGQCGVLLQQPVDVGGVAAGMQAS